MHVTVSSVRPPKSRFILRLVVAVLALLLIAFLGFDFWFYRAVRARCRSATARFISPDWRRR